MSAPRKSLEPFLKDEVEYYPHQVSGIRTAHSLNSFLLADDMGLGKSLQALTLFCIDIKMGRAETLLVVCPVTLRDNWADEIEKFTRIPYTLLGEEPNPYRPGATRKLSPTKREAQLVDWLNQVGPRVLITNYDQLASSAHTDTFASQTFDVVIFDESHTIKNPLAKRTKACLAVRSKRTFFLTGTPILNQINEIWTTLHRIDPAQFPRYSWFRNRYCVFGGWKGKQIVGTKNEKEIIDFLGKYMIRRLKNDVLSRDKPTIVPVIVGLSDVQQDLYDSTVEDLLLESPTGQVLDIENELTKFLRLKQICGTPYSIDPAFEDSSLKLDRVEEIVEELFLRGEKVVLFTQFRGVLECIVDRLNKRGLKPVFQLHGGVKDRVPVVQEWSRVNGPAAICCMSQVAGVGLNMVAASHAIRVDKLWVPGLNQQLVDRLDRIGQTNPVVVYDMLAKGTVEHRIEQILKGKERLVDKIVEGSVSMRRIIEMLKEQMQDDRSVLSGRKT